MSDNKGRRQEAGDIDPDKTRTADKGRGDKTREDDQLDEGLEESVPGSDAPAATRRSGTSDS